MLWSIHSLNYRRKLDHIKLSSYSQAKMSSIDIASGTVEAKIKALSFSGRLAINFKINQVQITPLHCYEVYKGFAFYSLTENKKLASQTNCQKKNDFRVFKSAKAIRHSTICTNIKSSRTRSQ